MEKIDWELVDPEGAVQIHAGRINPHPEDLAGKTVLLHWNRKHNGDLFLTRIGELLKEKIKDVKVIKGWEAIPQTSQISQNPEASSSTARKLASLCPDLVIGAPGD